MFIKHRRGTRTHTGAGYWKNNIIVLRLSTETQQAGEKMVPKKGDRNALTHGVYAIRDHGPTAMTPAQRGQYAELIEQLATREGTIDALRDAAVNTVILAQVAQNYCVSMHQAGEPLDQIPLLKSLPAFWNSAGRALKVYLDTIPDDHQVLDLASHIIRGMKDEQDT
jgi:hypothetical protein